jgi:GTP-binding protein HflX
LISLEKIGEEQKAILVGVQLPHGTLIECKENLEELKLLAETAGLQVEDTLIQERQKINPSTFIGAGKVQEITYLINRGDIKIVIFDDDLTPAQIRNLEKSWKVKVIDRTALILDIFAQHARTKIAKTQVELAQLQYLLPRLTRQWTHLSRQVGGIGIRGPGETQLETDRRLIRRRIEKLRRELKKIDKQQIIRRQQRQKLFRVTLVGYTNVGKSTIMQLLSGADVLIENQLFATLDSIIRRVKLNNHHEMLLGDTVGFIRKLPPNLVASFKSTLDEVGESDLLLHVVDVQHPRYHEQMQVVLSVLQELNLHKKLMIIVFNKIDKLPESSRIQILKAKYPNAVFLSAIRHIGVSALKKRIIECIEQNFITAILKVPLVHQRLLNSIYSSCQILNKTYLDEEVELIIKCDKKILYKIVPNDVRISIIENLLEEVVE